MNKANSGSAAQDVSTEQTISAVTMCNNENKTKNYTLNLQSKIEMDSTTSKREFMLFHQLLFNDSVVRRQKRTASPIL
jgi:hypothetical protein